MTNKLPKPDRRAEVLRLSLIEGKPIREIARTLNMSRKTVRGTLVAQPPRQATLALQPSRIRILDAYEEMLRKLVRDDEAIKAPAVLERLRAAGFTGGLTVVRDRLREIRPRVQHEPFLTLEHPPADQLQIDWFDAGFALPGIPRRVSGFVAVLAYSRMLYLEFVLSQRFGSFLRCMERALMFFQGVTTADVFDNMKTVVLGREGGTPRLHPGFVEYARVRAFAIRVCTPRKPYQKGGVERGIGFVRSRFLPGRRFASLLDMNRQATEWRDNFANDRVHEVTGKVPRLLFLHHEKAELKPITPVPFDTDDVDTDTVTKSFRVRFDRNTYSVKPHLLGQNVLVRADESVVRVFLGDKEVARHDRSWATNRDIEAPEHRSAAHELKSGATRGALPTGLTSLGQLGRDYLKVVTAGSRSIRREVTRLVFLVEVFGSEHLRSAIDEVMRSGHVGAEYVEYVLRHRRNVTPMPPPLRLGRPDLDGLALDEPDLSRYDALFPTTPLRDPHE
jgi:transposase